MRLKVSARSNPNAVAGAVSGVIRDHGRADVHVIGAGALNQAVKAVAIARGHLDQDGIDLVCVPSFVLIDVDGEQRTAIHLVIEDRGPIRGRDLAVRPRAAVAAGEGPELPGG